MIPNSNFKSPSASWRDRYALALTMALLLGGLGCVLFYHGSNINLYATTGTLVFAAFALTICTRPHTPLKLGPLGALLLAFFGWNILSTTWSSIPYISTIELGILGSGVGTYLIWRLWNAGTTTIPTPFLMVALGVGLSITMVAQHLAGFTPHAMFINPNSAAGFLNFLWPFAAITWLDAKTSRRIRLTALTTVFVMVIALSLAGSRGAMIGALGALAIVAYLGLGVLRDRRSTLTLVVVFALGLVITNIIADSAVSSGATSLTSPGSAGTSRFVIWQAAWAMVQDHFWLGYGPGVFWLAYSAFRSPNDGSSGFFVHNDYLEFWLETGLPGVLIVLGIGVACLWLFTRHCRRYYHHRVAATSDMKLATASFGGIAGVALHSFFTFNLQMMPFIFVLGILLAELERSTHAPTWMSPPVPSMRRALPIIGLALLSVICVGHFARTALSVSYANAGTAQMHQDAYTEAEHSFSVARGLWTQLDAPWYQNANVVLEALLGNKSITEKQRRELVDQATTMLDRAQQYNPYRAEVPLIRGLLRANFPDLTSGSALAALRHSIALNPRGIEARYALSQLYERAGDPDQAIRILERGLSIAEQAEIDATPLARQLHLLRERSASGSELVDDEPSPLHDQLSGPEPAGVQGEPPSGH